MPKKKKPAEKPEKQFERFVEAARKAGVDDSGKTAENEFKKLATGQQKKDR